MRCGMARSMQRFASSAVLASMVPGEDNPLARPGQFPPAGKALAFDVMPFGTG